MAPFLSALRDFLFLFFEHPEVYILARMLVSFC